MPPLGAIMQNAPDPSAAVPEDAAVITVNGVCPATPKPAGTAAAAAKPASAKTTGPTKPADCKTVITKAEFEKLANGVAPNVTPQLKKQLASVLPRFIAMSAEAKKRGLDKTPRFRETMKFAQMQILTNELQRSIQEDAAKVPDKEIAAYYKENPDKFEQYSLDRLFIPRTKQGDAMKDEEAEDADKDKDKEKKPPEEEQKAKEAEQKKKQEEAEASMAKLADDLRARAAAGEDFMKLQKEAFEAAGMKIESPTVSLPKVRRTGLPPAHAAVFDLKAGDVSQVISDTGGHYIYKIDTKEQLPLDQVKEEIHSTLQNQNTREAMEKVNGSFKSVTNEAYFGPPGPMQPPPRRPGPRMVPGPVTPNQTPPGAQQAPAAAQPAPAQAPAAKPN